MNTTSLSGLALSSGSSSGSSSSGSSSSVSYTLNASSFSLPNNSLEMNGIIPSYTFDINYGKSLVTPNVPSNVSVIMGINGNFNNNSGLHYILVPNYITEVTEDASSNGITSYNFYDENNYLLGSASYSESGKTSGNTCTLTVSSGSALYKYEILLVISNMCAGNFMLNSPSSSSGVTSDEIISAMMCLGPYALTMAAKNLFSQ